ncbi:MAG: response regulator [Oscillatoriophycideae cyanobacterium NC_groundwater_1537_Pr4_S-0.65um_50_18]|nr:response regulator [Oscillatoriophycideae cyanobacterium NC_groundwater_1537_Pr4_S-0.65um_50_18]
MPLEQDSTHPIQVLIVEDERIVARDIKACLEGLGYAVAGMATSGEEAIAKARDLRPDIVLMDIRLEGKMDGVEAAQQIWNNLQIPVIYATGYSDTATVDRATDSELFGYILKPIKERDLYIAIKNALKQQQQQTSLVEQQRWVSTILKAIGDGVIVTDAQGRVKYLNLVAESLTGWTLNEAVNQPLLQVFSLVDEQTQMPLENPVTEVLRTGKTVYLVNPVLLTTKDGRQITIADSAAPLRDEAGNLTGVVVVFRDVAERELVQERAIALQRSKLLEAQMSELQRLSQLKDDFLSTVSHELRSPLANIKMSIHMLEMSLDRQRLSSQDSEESSVGERITRYLKILRSECDQELNLVNDLLEIQRLEANVTLFDWTPIVFSEWIPEIIAAYEGRAEQQQVQIRVMLSESIPALISDRTILSSALSELLNNACKYTPPLGVITLSAQIAEPLNAAATLRLVVSNTGIRILPDELPHIFDKFYRAPSLASAARSGGRRQPEGTGLGLALVQKQIACLGGTIEAQSDLDEVRFVIHLPLTPTPHAGWQ